MEVPAEGRQGSAPETPPGECPLNPARYLLVKIPDKKLAGTLFGHSIEAL